MKSRSITTTPVATSFTIDIFRRQVRKPANYLAETLDSIRRFDLKMKRKPRRCLSSALLSTAVIVSLLAFAFTISVAPDDYSALAQSKPIETQAAGKLVVDGMSTELRHAYARKRTFRPPAPAGLIDLLVTNLPLEEDELTRVLEVNYEESYKLRGLWLIFDSTGAYKGERLLLQTGSVSAKGGVVIAMFDGTQNTRIENSRIRGQIQAKIQSPARNTAFDVSFDVPVAPRFVDTGSVKTSVPAEQFLKDFQTVMPGNWTIEKWRDDSGGTSKGTLSVHERIDEKSFRGTLHFVRPNGAAFDEEVVITCVGTKVHFDGRVPPEAKWYPDILTFDLKGNQLVGGGTDSGGNLMSVVLRKIK